MDKPRKTPHASDKASCKAPKPRPSRLPITAPKYVRDRDEVDTLAPTSPHKALEIARNITQPWYRTQSLATVAFYIPEPEKKLALLHQAFAAAQEQHEPNRIVTVSSWPLDIARRLKYWPLLEQITPRLLAIIRQEESPVRRSHALYYTLEALADAPPVLVLPVLEAFLEACMQPLRNGKCNRRGERYLVQMLPLIRVYAPERIELLLAQLHGAYRQNEARALLEKSRKWTL